MESERDEREIDPTFSHSESLGQLVQRRELPQQSCRARFKSAVGQTDFATPTPHAHAVALGALGSMHAPLGGDTRLTPAGLEKLLLAARSSGQLDLRERGLTEIPPEAFGLEDDADAPPPPAQAPATIDFDAPDEDDGPRWWETKPLTALLASRNAIAHVAGDLTRLPHLEVVHLDRNALESLPERALGSLLRLRDLDVSENKLRLLPESLPVETLARLACGGNDRIESLPESIGRCVRLAELLAPRCRLRALPDSFGALHALVRVDLSGNQLERISEEAARGFGATRELDVSRNKLVELPEAFGFSAPHALRVDARENKISRLPRSIGAMKKLAELYVGSNALEALPETLGDCDALATLDVSGNALRALPAFLAKLPSLAVLDASGNDVTVVAPELGTCANLRKLALDGNPLRSIPQSVVQGPTRELLRRLRARMEVDPDEGELRPTFGRDAAFAGRSPERASVAVAAAAARVAAMKSDPDEPRAGGLGPAKCDLRGAGLGPAVPAGVWAHCAKGVEALDLGDNPRLETVDRDALGACGEALQTLALDGCGLTSWPLPVPPGADELADDGGGEACVMSALREASLAGNASLGPLVPAGGFELAPALTRLDMSGVLGANDALENGLLAPLMETLVDLAWCGGGLTEIPSEVFGMAKLRALKLRDNKIAELPKATARVAALEELDLTNNDLATVPPELGRMRNLRHLGLEGNPLRSIRRPVIERGTAAVLEYLRDKIRE